MRIPVCAFLVLVWPVFALSQTAESERLGAAVDASGQNVEFRITSTSAERIELDLFDDPFAPAEKLKVTLSRDPATNVWSARVPVSQLQAAGIQGPIYYGYRAWGPNWKYDPTWKPGSTAGFVADVDGQGNRFNPNKLLVDPYAREVSHNPLTPRHPDMSIYASGDGTRQLDSAPVAPKGIVLPETPTDVGPRPTRAFKDDVIYEAHVRGLTMNDPSIPPEVRGTFKGAALKAAELRKLGVTAIEFLPVFEFQNQTNDQMKSAETMNYWGYGSLSFFAPSRRYSSDKSAGGPTREFREMVKAFHEQGIKVYLDVAFSFTGEGNIWKGDPSRALLLSWRGLDNRTFYSLSHDPRFYYDTNGVGGNLNTANEVVRRQLLDVMKYWPVDGYRADLAPNWGNVWEHAGFVYNKMDPNNLLNRAVRELPDRVFIAEPWGVGAAGYRLGEFPSGWAEWNGRFRDSIRADLNQLGMEAITAGEIAARVSGSPDLFQWNGRKPWASINYLASHDGFTMRDLFGYLGKVNQQAWPRGPSDGGDDNNRSWDHHGDPARQRQVARTAMALTLLSAGVPMILAGDEMLRTQYGNNNTYNLDTEANWLNYENTATNKNFLEFTRGLIEFRRAHPALRPDNWFRGIDTDGTGLKDITWYTNWGREADAGYMSNPINNFLAWRVDGKKFGDSARSIYVAYNGWQDRVDVTLPDNVDGKRWFRVADTDGWMEGQSNIRPRGREERLTDHHYSMPGRSLLILVESTEPELKAAATRTLDSRGGSSVGRFVKREAVGAAEFAAAFVVKEGFKAIETRDWRKMREAALQLKEPSFWASLAGFTAASKAMDFALARLPMPAAVRGVSRAALPLAAGMTAINAMAGRVSAKDVLLGTGAFMVSGFVVNGAADALVRPMLYAMGVSGGWGLSLYAVGKLSVSLYLGEKLEGWLHRLWSAAERPMEGVIPKLGRLGAVGTTGSRE